MRRGSVIFLCVLTMAGIPRRECDAQQAPTLLQASIEFEQWLGRPVQDRFPDALTLDSPNAAARYLILLDCLDQNAASRFGWLTRESMAFEVADDATFGESDLRVDAARLDLWVQELVEATRLPDCNWHFAADAWPRLLPPDDPRRGVRITSRRADELLLGLSRLSLADGNVESAVRLSVAQLRFVEHRLAWGVADPLYVAIAQIAAQKGAAHAALLAEVLSQRPDTTKAASDFANSALEHLDRVYAENRHRLRDVVLNQAKAKIDLLSAWASIDPLDERLAAVLELQHGASTFGRSLWRTFMAQLLGASAEKFFAAFPPDAPALPFRTLLCADEARELLAHARQVISEAEAAWTADDWEEKLKQIDAETDGDPTRIRPFLYLGLRPNARAERRFQAELTVAREKLRAVANR